MFVQKGIYVIFLFHNSFENTGVLIVKNFSHLSRHLINNLFVIYTLTTIRFVTTIRTSIFANTLTVQNVMRSVTAYKETVIFIAEIYNAFIQYVHT